MADDRVATELHAPLEYGFPAIAIAEPWIVLSDANTHSIRIGSLVTSLPPRPCYTLARETATLETG
jgi:alkanesulfonate monooxygenase SsuD/methylene tetrahydromethanopterin reductase-like flavin-dependent oxidoreductase (luciferase family)